MNAERWQQVSSIFQEVVEASPDLQNRILDDRCSGEPELRAEVEALLSAHREAGDFLESSPLPGGAIDRLYKHDESMPTRMEFENYSVIGEIARGGMGVVYEALDLRLRRRVALKVLIEGTSADHASIQRFRREARAASALNHPNICTVYEFTETKSYAFIAMEILEGETLRQTISRGPISLEESVAIARQITAAVGAAHVKGILHRDIKPANIFRLNSGEIKVLDFGLAKIRDTQVGLPLADSVPLNDTRSGVIIGTIGYLSPEQLTGRTTDHRSDIFSIGLVILEMLSGVQAFARDSQPETIAAIIHEDPLAPSRMTAPITSGIKSIVRRCIEKAPENRFQSAEELLAALESLNLSEKEYVEQKPYPRLIRRWLPWSIVPAAAGVFACLLALQSAPAPVIKSFTQITSDSEPKEGGLVSDGTRLYFNEGQNGSFTLAEVSTAGGQVAPLKTRLANPMIRGITRDGSELYVTDSGWNDPTSSLWAFPLPIGEPRALANVRVSGLDNVASLSEGKVVFARGRSLVMTETLGEDPISLLSSGGELSSPSISTSQKVISFWENDHGLHLLKIAKLNGENSKSIYSWSHQLPPCCAELSDDGRFVFVADRPTRSQSDLLAIATTVKPFSTQNRVFQLTNGPMAYTNPLPGKDGSTLYAIGTLRRGELVSFDSQTRKFIPLLSDISAVDPTYSTDGKWVTYSSYPDHTLWRSRSDGTEQQQLTFPPMQAYWPYISPDGGKVSFCWKYQIYIADAESRHLSPTGVHGCGASWSPDGRQLVYNSDQGLRLLDAATGKNVPVEGGEQKLGGQWVADDTLVAANAGSTQLFTLNLRTKQWKELVSGTFVNWMISPDHKYLFVATGNPENEVLKVDLATRSGAKVVGLDGLRGVYDFFGTQISVSPDNSPIFTKDTGTQEIYALHLAFQ